VTYGAAPYSPILFLKNERGTSSLQITLFSPPVASKPIRMIFFNLFSGLSAKYPKIAYLENS
jgi:hypothetical protein